MSNNNESDHDHSQPRAIADMQRFELEVQHLKALKDTQEDELRSLILTYMGDEALESFGTGDSKAQAAGAKTPTEVQKRTSELERARELIASQTDDLEFEENHRDELTMAEDDALATPLEQTSVAEFKTLQEMLSNADARLDDIKAEIIRLQEARTLDKIKLRELEKELTDFHDTSETQKLDFEYTIKELKNSLTDTSNKLWDARAQADEYETRIETLEYDLGVAITDAQFQREWGEKFCKDRNKLIDERDQYLSDIEEQKQTSAATIKTLRMHLSATREGFCFANAESNNTKADIIRLQEARESDMIEFRELEQELTTLQNISEEKEQASAATIKTLQDSLADTSDKLHRSNARSENMKAGIIRLQEARASDKIKLGELEQELATLQNTSEEKEHASAATINTLQDSLDAATKRTKELEEENLFLIQLFPMIKDIDGREIETLKQELAQVGDESKTQKSTYWLLRDCFLAKKKE